MIKKRLIKISTIVLTMASIFTGTMGLGYSAGTLYGDTIPQKYQGYYYCDSNDTNWMFVTGATSSVFRGYYVGDVSGNLACSDLDPNKIYFDPVNKINGENFEFNYNSWSKLVNNEYYATQTGVATIEGNYSAASKVFTITRRTYSL